MFAGLILVSLLCAAASGVQAAGVQELDEIVAVVNDDVIVRSELEREIQLVVPQLQREGTEVPPRPQLEKQVLDRMILKHLEAQRAKQLGISVDDATLDQAMENIASRNGLTIDELQQALAAGGIDFQAFREDTRSQILTGKLQTQAVAKQIHVTDQEVDRFLKDHASQLIDREQVRLQHILIALPETPTPEQVRQAEDKARKLVVKLRSGADFAAVAARDSDGRNALQGGDLGWFDVNAVPALVSKLALTMDKGEISSPLRSPSGFHIIKLSDIKGKAPENITETHARHILIRTNELVSDSDAKRRLTVLRNRILNGEDFALLARAHSDDTGSALKGGDLGWVKPGDTVPQFESVMNSLKDNEISQPFQSPFGWHIVQVLEHRTQESTDEVMRLRAREALQQQKAEEAMDNWLRQLRDEAYVEVRLDPDDQ